VRAYDKFQAALTAYSRECDDEEASFAKAYKSGKAVHPDWPLWVCNPKRLETSISV